MKQYLTISSIARLIAVVFLFLALGKHPYSFYDLLRWITFAACAAASAFANRPGKKNWAYVFLFVALLFNPFFPVRMDRQTWNTLDVIIGVFLLISIYFEPGDNQLPQKGDPKEAQP